FGVWVVWWLFGWFVVWVGVSGVGRGCFGGVVRVRVRCGGFWGFGGLRVVVVVRAGVVVVLVEALLSALRRVLIVGGVP
ncbi:hypothetical protein, partial [Pseudomonas syringae group genomosp. 7]|uniref:hypothetical protein n=1 Tax=Pseudomonas syringae group genomosp. 7 TaxID=251699 RepID=UPI0037704186